MVQNEVKYFKILWFLQNNYYGIENPMKLREGRRNSVNGSGGREIDGPCQIIILITRLSK